MRTLLQNSEKERDECWLFFKKSFMKPLVVQFTLEPLFISFVFFFAVGTFDQSHSLMEADCAHKLPGGRLCSTTECETGLFCQQTRKTPFYKHYLPYKFLKLYELLMFLDFLMTFRYPEALS